MIFRQEDLLADGTNRSMFQISGVQSNLKEAFSKIAIKNDCLVIVHYLTLDMYKENLNSSLSRLCDTIL